MPPSQTHYKLTDIWVTPDPTAACSTWVWAGTLSWTHGLINTNTQPPFIRESGMSTKLPVFSFHLHLSCCLIRNLCVIAQSILCLPPAQHTALVPQCTLADQPGWAKYKPNASWATSRKTKRGRQRRSTWLPWVEQTWIMWQGPALSMDEHARLRPILRGKRVNSAALETTDLCLVPLTQTVLLWQRASWTFWPMVEHYFGCHQGIYRDQKMRW